MSSDKPEIRVEPIDGGYLVKVGDRSETILRTEHLIEEAARLAPQLGVEANEIVLSVNRSVEKEVDAILDSPRPLERLRPYLDDIIAGEDMNKLLLFTLLLSGKVKDHDHCEMILLKSESGAGKSTLANALTKPFKTKKVGRFTEHALDHSDLSRYDVLYIQEIGQMDDERQGLSANKFLSADDQGYTVEMTIGNPKEGFTTVEKRIPPMTVVSSTTRVKIDPQYERRNWNFGVDETPEQTERIRLLKAKIQREKNEVNLGLRDELSGQRAQRILTRLVEKIKSCRIVIPFSENLLEILDKEKLRVRGDYEKIMRMLEYYCILKQRILPKKERSDGEAVVFATPAAALEILRVAVEPLTLITLQLDKRTKKLLDEFRKIGLTSAGATITPEIREEMTRDLGVASNTLRIYLNELVDKRYLTDDDKRPKTYRLVESLSSIERKASALSAKIENADKFTTQMRREALKTLETLTEKTGDTDAEALTTLFTTDVSTSTRTIFAENSSAKETGRKQETTQDEPHFTDLRISLREQLELLRRILHNIKEDENQGPILCIALREHLGWDEDTFNRIFEVAKRDRAVYESRPGYLVVTR